MGTIMSSEDVAQELEIRVWEYNNRTRTPTKEYTPADLEYGPEFCAECEDVMPELRRRMGKYLCTACQTEHEKFKGRQ